MKLHYLKINQKLHKLVFIMIAISVLRQYVSKEILLIFFFNLIFLTKLLNEPFISSITCTK